LRRNGDSQQANPSPVTIACDKNARSEAWSSQPGKWSADTMREIDQTTRVLCQSSRIARPAEREDGVEDEAQKYQTQAKPNTPTESLGDIERQNDADDDVHAGRSATLSNTKVL
jgi:hypothetical protein